MKQAEAEVELCCGVFTEAYVFSVVVARSGRVEKLRDAIARVVNVRSHLLTLRLAWRKKGGWLESGDDLEPSLRKGVDTSYAKLNPLCRLFRRDESDGVGYFTSSFTPGESEVHILVELPSTTSIVSSDPAAAAKKTTVADDIIMHLKGKLPTLDQPKHDIVLDGTSGAAPRKPASDWFPDKMEDLPVTGVEGQQISYKYLKMRALPPLAHPDTASPEILERQSYRDIFDGLMEEVKQSLGGVDKNLVVEGNPGIGKSRFYVYCAFRLVRGLVDEDMKLREYTLVLNFGDDYRKYLWDEKAFVRVGMDEILDLQESASVLRLVEAYSSTLLGWRGVSILFTSPALKQLHAFKKVKNSKSFISPMWELAELRVCNVLVGEAQRLSDDELESRFVKWGGNPRFIFGESPGMVNMRIESAIGSFSAQDILHYKDSPTRADKYSHSIIARVPTSPDYRIYYDLQFVSKVVAAKVIESASDQTLKTLVSFVHDWEKGGTAVSLRQQLYEAFVHRWITRSGGSGADQTKGALQRTRSVTLRVPGKPPVQLGFFPKEDAEHEVTARAGMAQAKPSRELLLQNSGSKRKRGGNTVELKPPASQKPRHSADPKSGVLPELRTPEEEGENDAFAHRAIQIPQNVDLKSEWFDTLSDITPTEHWTYYRPKSRIYAVDALIVELMSESDSCAGTCYGVKMTTSMTPNINAFSVEKISNWAKSRGYQFALVFVAPPKVAPDVNWQSLLTFQGAEQTTSEIPQFVAAIDPYTQFRT